MSFAFAFGGGGAAGGAPAVRSVVVPAGATGRVVSLVRLLGSTSTFSLLSAGNANIALDNGDGLKLATALAANETQTALVREQIGSGPTARAIEYPINCTGGGAPTPTPTPVSSRITPTNWDVIGIGDSRTDTVLAGTLTGTAGYTAGTSIFGPIGWVQVLSQNRLKFGRYPNFGISASTTTQGAAVPRQNASGVVTNSSPQTWFRGTDSTNKGMDYAAAHPAGIAVILYGVNDADSLLSSTSRTNLLAILNNLRPGQLKVILNETGTGKKIDGSIAGGTTANKLAFSAWINTLDADSGHANARNDVLVVDSMGPSYDAASGTNHLGWLRDDRHPTPWGSRKWGQLVIDRLAAAYGSVWTNLPKRITLPTAAGAPFIHSNPLLTPGGNGQVVGANFGTAPTAATIPQGWAVSGTGAGAGITVTCDKTGTTPDGFPMFQISVSGTLPDQSSYTLQIYQLASGSAVALTDKLQGVCKRRVLPGSQQLLGARLRISITDATVAKSQGAYDQGGSPGGSGDRLGYYINSAGFDAGGEWEELQTQMIDLADPNMDAANGGPGLISSPSQVVVYMDLQFGNYTGATANVSATVQLAQMGMLKVSV
ncbi:hypothetical protein S2M10_31520 [Sphingomonas sp. S2M10]|uniref:SGNH/GDSL hydrolase family protein n=1 Tax=Sphingomonas sp. S2M10 TaxID=2705010 RepID=UPI00145631A7|nr:SGNH/GDSL hydrolase family protein [Sphingomonas sp. S2M10]NLS28143.1 hypothetical protein [Sphingomonas sp. S2M10]